LNSQVLPLQVPTLSPWVPQAALWVAVSTHALLGHAICPTVHGFAVGHVVSTQATTHLLLWHTLPAPHIASLQHSLQQLLQTLLPQSLVPAGQLPVPQLPLLHTPGLSPTFAHCPSLQHRRHTPSHRRMPLSQRRPQVLPSQVGPPLLVPGQALHESPQDPVLLLSLHSLPQR
jgi:hypothetical protein